MARNSLHGFHIKLRQEIHGQIQWILSRNISKSSTETRTNRKEFFYIYFIVLWNNLFSHSDFLCCRYSPACLLFSLLGLFLIAAGIAAMLLTIIITNATTTTTTTTTSATSTTSTTTTTTTTSTTSTTTTTTATPCICGYCGISGYGNINGYAYGCSITYSTGYCYYGGNSSYSTYCGLGLCAYNTVSNPCSYIGGNYYCPCG